ncbi:peptidylprolyl isomerase [Cognatiyoonia koreensis]|uniref:Peptidyl-prolyl cis-trans isomerase n=1 Tax=Cognatiyoonia koreensis TaxID=364200 RepID=A0A1I0QRE5_9RHOB|nr:peptidylprolyl isomerase [Cognatiyoonia koreensis]SEW29932.1 peptidylprolyl isomerase [Cognatiyoonia koreensis]
MTTAKSGDTVRIHYTGTLTNGDTFDSSTGRDPLEFEVGSGMIIPGLDAAIPGMAVGDKKTVNVPCDQAYGQRHDEGIQAVPKADFPPEIPLEVGLQLQMQTPDGRAMPVTVAEISDTEVTLDANHRLAGQDLVFDIEMVAIDAA